MEHGDVDFAPVRFSTADLPVRDRIPILREEYGRKLVRLDIEPPSDRPLKAEMTLRRLPDLRVGTLTSPELRAARTPELIDDNDDVFGLVMEFGGTSIMSSRGRSVMLGVGDAVLLHSMEPISTMHLDTKLVSANIPRAALAPLVGNVEDATIRVIPAESEALRLLSIYLQAMLEELRLANAELRLRVTTHVHDLIALAIGATRDGTALAESRGLIAARLTVLKADIIANLGRRDLSPAFIGQTTVPL